ncbi:MAG TPA: hypothetical protein VNW99_08160 [Cytophagaceae bacterium]|jgi:hypothetical protein|nr:hypothetical protein [Cytophagaceae bacterium]
MKYFFYSLLITSLGLLSACSSSGVKREEAIKKDTAQTTIVEQPKISEPVSNASLGSFSYWKGALNPKNIELTLWLSQKGNILVGEVIYTKSGKPIKVAGKKDGEYYIIYEFDKAGNITGIYSLQLVNDSLNGSWRSPQNKKSYDFKSSNTPSSRIMNVDSLFRPKPAPLGKYRYSFGDEGGQGVFTCEDVLQDRVHLQLNAVTAAPAYNIATVDDTVAFGLSMKATVLEYKTNEGACQFNITFFDNFASIDYVDNKADCEFGNNAYASGIYSKVK